MQYQYHLNLILVVTYTNSICPSIDTMNNFTIISYPGSSITTLLSLTQNRSQYMLPFAGRFRVVDFTLRNSFSSEAKTTLIYSNYNDGLGEYVDQYGFSPTDKFPPVKIISRDYSDINLAYHLIMESNTDYYLIYNGDAPTIIDFKQIIKHYKSANSPSILYCLNMQGKPSMAYTVLVTVQRELLDVINNAMEVKSESPNIFEMIINTMINNGIPKSSFHAYYWPIKTVPEYYDINRHVISDPRIFSLLYHEKIIQSQIKAEGFAHVDKNAKITNSFISDYCHINGTVHNSIIYPGVKIEKNTHVTDSIILPYVKIAGNCRIVKTIIGERESLGPEDDAYNLDTNCRIGSSDEFIKNNDFPRILFNSITLISGDARIPEGTRIGGGCYLASGLNRDYFSNKKIIYDGMSVQKIS